MSVVVRGGGELCRVSCLAMALLLACVRVEAGAKRPVWVEAESYGAQQGSQARFYAMPGASGGRIVDNDWGGRATDFLRYKVALPTDAAKLHITLRYARAMPGPSVVLLQLDGKPDPPVRMTLRPTGGWGFTTGQWRLAHAELPAARAGDHTLEIRSTRAGNNVNLDGFFLSDRPITRDPMDRPIPESPELRKAVRRLGPIAFVVQHHLGNPDGVVRYHSRHVVKQWGCRIQVCDPSRPDQPPKTIFKDPAGAIFDMNLSFDARTLFFTFRRGYDDTWHLHEISTEGEGLRQITKGGHHDFAPAELPGGGLVFASTRVRSFNICAQELSSVLFTCRRGGTGIRQITVNTLNDMSPQMLPNGQILYTRWEYVDRDVKWRQSLWTVNPDGTMVQLYFGNTIRDPAVFWQARPIPGRDAVAATFAPHHGWPMGAIGTVTPVHGPEAPRGLGFRWITAEYPVILDNGRLPEWGYRDPFPVSEDLFLVSYGGGPRGPNGRFRICLLSDRGDKAVVWQDPKLSCTWPLLLRPRPVPPRHGPLARQAEATTGTLLVQDVYAGLGPSVRRGEITHLRIIEQPPKFPVNESGPRAYEMTPVMGRRCYYRKRVLGTVPVEADGSAHFTVPALRELYIQALDAEGRAVQSMGSAVNVVPGERRTCVGCHERREEAPPQAVAIAAGKPPVAPTPYAWGNDGNIDFARIVQPVLDKHCVRCHGSTKLTAGGGPTPDGGADLSGDKTRYFNMAYDTLYDRGLVHTIILTRNDSQVIPPKKAFAYVSRLREYIEGKHYDTKLTRDERERLYVWMDTNANYYGTHERTRPGTRGGRDLWAGPWFSRDFLTVYAKHCGSCHGKRLGHEGYPQRSAWINLTHPARSRVLTAHLAKTAGGFGLDKPQKGKPPPLFASTDDPVYRALLAAIEQGRRALLANPRIDMPGAVPKPGRNDWGRFRGTAAAPGPAEGKFWPDERAP